MFRRLITIAALAGAGLISTNAVHASHLGYKSTHIIGGKGYFYTLNFFAVITALTGRDIKDGTTLDAQVKVLGSATICGNPQTFMINPGVGPQGTLFLQSEPLDDGDLLNKQDRTKSTFAATATAAQLVDPAFRLRDDLGLCKESSGQGSWVPTFWEDLSPPCTKEGDDSAPKCYGAYTAATGYTRLAMWVNNTLTLIPSGASTFCTRTSTGDTENPYIYSGCASWTFVFLPTTFAINAFVIIGGEPDPDSNFYWSCQFTANNDPGAPKPGEPYSVNNPPDAGWSGSLENAASYNCVEITAEQYADL